MAHFAKILEGEVINVIVAEQDFMDNFIDSTPGTWVQTSYNTLGGVHYQRNDDGSLGDASDDQTKALRKNFAGVGYKYDADADAFHAPQPFPSWTLNQTTFLWEPPVAIPSDAIINGGTVKYYWNEDAYQADNTTGWVLAGGSE